MTHEECVRLCRTVRALRPAQLWTPETPDAWHLVLADVPLELAQQAAVVAARTEKWIGTDTICDTIEAARKARAREHFLHREALSRDPDLVPDADPDDAVAYLAAVREGRYRRVEAAPPAAVGAARVAAIEALAARRALPAGEA